jgi:hypothetical protein
MHRSRGTGRQDRICGAGPEGRRAQSPRRVTLPGCQRLRLCHRCPMKDTLTAGPLSREHLRMIGASTLLSAPLYAFRRTKPSRGSSIGRNAATSPATSPGRRSPVASDSYRPGNRARFRILVTALDGYQLHRGRGGFLQWNQLWQGSHSHPLNGHPERLRILLMKNRQFSNIWHLNPCFRAKFMLYYPNCFFSSGTGVPDPVEP